MGLSLQMLLFWLAAVIVSPGYSLRPRIQSDTANAYVFEGENATLSWSIENEDGYAIVWQYTDGSGGGRTAVYIAMCSFCSGQETCSIEQGMEQKYAIRKHNRTLYDLSIVGTTSSESIGLYEALYAQVENCDSIRGYKLRGFRLLHSARVYIYEDPRCTSSRGGTDDEDLVWTCTWGPRFYAGAESQAQPTLLLDRPFEISSELDLPFGVVLRIGNTRGQQSKQPTTGCEVTLPRGEGMRSCEFPIQGEHDTSVEIVPMTADTLAGQTQEMHCQIRPNATSKRRWVICRENGACTEISRTNATAAGDISYYTSNNETTLYLTPGAEISRFFIECIVETGGGSHLSAFASLTVIDPTRPSDKPTPATEIHWGLDIIVFIAVPSALIIILIIVGVVVTWKRTHPRRSLKQPPRLPPTVAYDRFSTRNAETDGFKHDDADSNKTECIHEVENDQQESGL